MSTKKIALRKFSSKDLEKVMLVNQECLPENYAPSFFLDISKNCPDAFLVAQINGDLVGYIMCRLENGFSDFKRFRVVKKGHIVSIAVKPEYRRKKVGSILLRGAIEALRKYDMNEVYMEVRTANQNAINMYNKLDFEFIRKVKSYYQDGSDAHMMGIKIPVLEKNVLESGLD